MQWEMQMMRRRGGHDNSSQYYQTVTSLRIQQPRNLHWKCIYNIFLFSDAIVAQVLDELGLQLTDELTGLPSEDGSLVTPKAEKSQPTPVAAGATGGGPADDVDADLEARLNNLKRD